MMKTGKRGLFWGLLAAGLTGFVARASADGIIIPHPRPGEHIPPLWVKYHHVTVEIRDQLAKTQIDEVFVNTYPRDLEGTFLFPLPEGAAISEFAMIIGEEKVEGRILDSREARTVYEDIVRRLRDPALLEYIGRNAFQARVFPIPALGEKRIQLTYSEVLKGERGLVRYLYPLNTERFSLQPLEDVALSVRVESRVPIAGVYSPSHRVSVRREGPGTATLGYEEKNVRPDKDFIVYYSVSSADVGLSFLDCPDPQGGYFLLLAAPQYIEAGEKVMNKNLVFVLDSSGSMSGKKIQQAREAARFVIEHLDKDDRFSIIDFDDGVTLFSPDLAAADPANREKARKFIAGVEDSGGTNINEALIRALGMMPVGDRPNYILFLTDGLPTVGVTGIADILKNVAGANKADSRLVVFGVGYDVNTELLDKLSNANRGTSIYVDETENLEVAVSSTYEKISSPLFADIRLDFQGIDVSQMYPAALPDLFRGSQLVVLGRYRGNGPVSVKLSGKVGMEARTFTLDGQRLNEDGPYPFLPRLWATRRVGYLLEEIRLHGESKELADEVRNLGLKFGIVTPYTSFLVTEREREGIAAAAPAAQEALTARKVTGAGAVKLAQVTQQFKDKDQASEVVSEKILYKEDKVFYLRDGFWVDSLYPEGSAVEEIRFDSAAYFDLIGRVPRIGRYLSVGRKVIISLGGKNYKIVPDPE
jgi:Ca-activated chloride channel homolog